MDHNRRCVDLQNQSADVKLETKMDVLIFKLTILFYFSLLTEFIFGNEYLFTHNDQVDNRITFYTLERVI